MPVRRIIGTALVLIGGGFLLGGLVGSGAGARHVALLYSGFSLEILAALVASVSRSANRTSVNGGGL